MERARTRFPEDVERTFIYKEDASGIPVAVINLQGHNRKVKPYLFVFALRKNISDT